MPTQAISKTSQARRIVILGGGYAAMAAVNSLAKQAPGCHVTLIAPRKAHIKITLLHETLRYSLGRICVPYAELAKRFGFRFIQGKLRFNPENLPVWQQRQTLRLGTTAIPFDYLILATGAKSLTPEKSEHSLTVDDFCLNQGQAVIQEAGMRERAAISVVGAGATGIQLLFELSHLLKRKSGKACQLRLINYESRVLGQFPQRFHDYVLERLLDEGIDYFPNATFKCQTEDSIVLSHRETGEAFKLPSGLSLLFMGVKPNPFPIQTNAFGQVMANGETLNRIFAAGDCAHFTAPGANTPSAQVAIRKGKTVAENVLREGVPNSAMRVYDYTEQGYFVSLGLSDGIGWLGKPENIFTGLPAVALKKAIESKYSLMLSGID